MTEELTDKAQEILESHQQQIYQRTDRMLAVLLLIEYLAAIIAALILSPRTWAGSESAVHLHVWIAILLGGAIISAPVALAVFLPGRTITRHVIAAGQMLMSALLIHLSGGRIETHFHVFGSLAFLSFYRDWRVLMTASIIVTLDHWARGLYWPQSVYGILTPEPYRWLEHLGWVVFENIFLVLAIRQSTQEMKAIANRRAALEKTENELQEAILLRETFMSICSHELKTPLTSLKLQTQLGKRLLGDSTTRIYKVFDTADRQIDRLSRLVEEMLDLSAIQTGKLSIQLEEVQLSHLIQEVVERCRFHLEAAGCTITLEVQQELFIACDRHRLEQVFINLITNCAKYGAGKPVKVTASHGPSSIRLSVQDQGIGIAKSDQEKVFKRFERAVSEKSISGLGLGLYITRTIVEQHGGRIWVESELGRGSTFHVELPTNPSAPRLNKPKTQATVESGLRI